MEKDKQVFLFKTNINCSGCISKVKPYLDSAGDLCEWVVDIKNKDKTLTVKSDGITESQVIETVKKAGFNIEVLND